MFKKLKIDWPNVWAEKGWATTIERFNQDGYGLMLVDAEGIVRGVNLRKPRAEQLLHELYPDVPKKDDATTKPTDKSRP